MAAVGSTTGLTYSIVDMNLAAGMGSVTIKNISLNSGRSNEKLTATRHANNIDFWVMTHEGSTDNYKAYLLTSVGVNTTAVVSAIGEVLPINMVGCIKFSPDGQKFVDARASPVALGVFPFLVLYNFNKITGVLSNSLSLPSDGNSKYGCEFSSDGTKLYASNYGIVQWNLSAGSNSAIQSSSFVVFSVSGSNGGAMSAQLVPNGKIYFAALNSFSIHVIDNPNVAGAGCNFVAFGQPVSAVVTLTNGGTTTSSSWYGLPNSMLSSSCTLSFILQGNHVVCSSGNMTNAGVAILAGNSGNVNYSWTNGSVTYTTAQVNVLSIGNWTVTATDSTGCEARDLFTVSQTTTTIDILVSSVNSCAGSPVTLSASSANTYTWSNGVQMPSIVVSPTSTTQYSVSATDQYDCIRNSSLVTIDVMPLPQLSVIGNSVICIDDTSFLTASGATTYTWSNSAQTQSIAVSPNASTQYYVSGSDENGCVGNIPVTVSVVPPPALTVGGTFTICSPQILTLTVSGAYSYYWEWNTAHATSTAIILKPNVTTQYTVTGTHKIGCKSTEVVTVTVGCVGIDELKDESLELRVYPNPVNSVMNVELRVMSEQQVEIFVYDILGNTVIHNSSFITHNSAAALDVRGLKSGIYFIKAGNEVRKFVKE
ncbi:MAG: T9SS type A sorting domain-containing protein [Bacteroidetes bacterium]|nr:T9SS type A sorting domain-containing protein [Bacteroidota bacterium]